MKRSIPYLIFIGTVVGALAMSLQVYGQGEVRHSVLASGEWYKLKVGSDSIYKIDFNYLSEIGLNPSTIDPRKIKIYGNGGKMLPQSNAITRPKDLVENHIFIKGEEDGVFNSDDYILFFGQEADTYEFDLENQIVLYKNNDYDDFSYYYLTLTGSDGLRVCEIPNPGINFPEVETYFSYSVHEVDKDNLVISGRQWFERISATDLTSLGFSFPGFVQEKDVTITSSVMARTFNPAEFSILNNNKEVGKQVVGSVPDGTYTSRGKIDTQTFKFRGASVTGNPDSLVLSYRYGKAEGRVSTPYLDYLLVTAHSKLELYNDQTIFRSWVSTDLPNITFSIANGNENTMIWDISNPLSPMAEVVTISNNKIKFGISGSNTELKSHIAFDPDKVLVSPHYEGKVENQDIQGLGPANLIIVSYPDFVQEANRLGQLRRQHDGLTVHVVTTEMVYNEFSSGSQDISAIRDFLKYMYDIDHSEKGIRYALLFGRGSYDYKSRTEFDTNYVPIYESRNSLHPIYSYSSDDYFGFMEDSEGDWIETSAGDHTLELGIGRLPVKSIEEARVVVDKYYTYALNSKSFGKWRNNVSFVADDGDNNLHMKQANRLADTVTMKENRLNIKKIYVDSYKQTNLPETAPGVNRVIDQVVDEGTLIVNFTGHGNERQWTKERILDIPMIDNWTNEYRLPLFITATCEFGRNDDPALISGGERMILKEKGGAIALVTTARPVFASQNFEVNNAFYQSILASSRNKNLRLGDVFKETKNNSLSGSVNRNFSLLGDPSLKLAFPENSVELETINGQLIANADTLKALSKVTLTGSVKNLSGDVLNQFNGTLDMILFEKSTVKITLGNENPSYIFSERDNIIFKGKASVNEGMFVLSFIMPKNISYQYGFGKLSFYAYSSVLNSDASGASGEVIIGGSDVTVLTDIDPPDIQLFMGDTTYQSGMIVKPNTLLVAKLFDESGITISQSILDQNIQAIIDGGSVVNLNEYYEADLDTYQSGWVNYPMNNLEPGPHTITIKAWDVFNNPAEAHIEFIVSEKDQLTMENLRNYPNPFVDFTNFTFEHNRAGEDLDIHLQIFNSNGSIVKETKYDLYQSFTTASGIEWDGRNTSGQKVRPGLYYYKIIVRSTLDGAMAQLYQKLIIY